MLLLLPGKRNRFGLKLEYRYNVYLKNNLPLVAVCLVPAR